MTLRRQLILLVAGPTLIIYALILGIAAIAQYRQSKQEVELAMTRLAASYSSRLDGYLREAARIAETTAHVLESNVEIDDETLYNLLSNNVAQMPLVYGSCLAFEPGTRRPEGELFAPYVYRGKDGQSRMNIDGSVYDWYRDPSFTWFQEPKRLGHGVWSAPYFDEGAGNILMSTYSAPFKQNDSFGGVCTVDIDLPRLRETVGREIDQQLDFVIVAPDGKYVFHPDSSRIMARTVFEYLEDVDDGNSTDIATPIRDMLSGKTGAAWLPGWETAEPLGIFYAPIPSTGWLFVARLPTDAVLRNVRRRTVVNALALAATLLITAGCIYLVAGRIAAPITSLEQAVSAVGRGNLDTQINESAPTVEVRKLAGSFNRMTAELRATVDRLAREQSERQRIEHDLDIARQIQVGLLPTSKPNVPGYDIAGWSQAANKTGGDYFDWQILPDGRILVSLADVSGHGIGPALVAAVCRAYARATVSTNEVDLARILDRINSLLVEDMPEGRFVTFVAVLLDPVTHRAQMVSAGHGPLFRCMTSRGELIESGADGIPFGLIPDSDYGPANEFVLEPADSLLLVTDGIFEWTNPSGESFGLERLREAIRALATSPADDMIRGLYDKAHQFAGDVAQEDDVTIVIIRRT
jgi:sigma-B regulation protein RsbU (phosphoserine phosphatase)